MKDERTIGKVNVYSDIPKDTKLTRKHISENAKIIFKATLSVLFTSAVIVTTITTIPIAREAIYLKRAGVSTKDSICASVDPDYIQPELRETVEEMDKVLENRFPDIKFHDSGNVVLSSKDWSSKDNSVDELAGFYHGIYDAAVFHTSYPNRQAHENIHRRIRHTVVKENGETEEYNGLSRLTDGKGDKLSEALTTWLENDLYGEDTCYFEHKYLDLMFYFISVDDLVKIAAEGSMEDLEALFAPYFDCDIIDLIDKTPGYDEAFIYGPSYVIDGLNYRANLITDAFYKSISMSEEPSEEKMKKIESYRQYLSKNFVKSVEHFDEVFVDYINRAPSK